VALRDEAKRSERSVHWHVIVARRGEDAGTGKRPECAFYQCMRIAFASGVLLNKDPAKLRRKLSWTERLPAFLDTKMR